VQHMFLLLSMRQLVRLWYNWIRHRHSLVSNSRLSTHQCGKWAPDTLTYQESQHNSRVLLWDWLYIHRQHYRFLPPHCRFRIVLLVILAVNDKLDQNRILQNTSLDHLRKVHRHWNNLDSFQQALLEKLLVPVSLVWQTALM
jgi:hypothetical protein